MKFWENMEDGLRKSFTLFKINPTPIKGKNNGWGWKKWKILQTSTIVLSVFFGPRVDICTYTHWGIKIVDLVKKGFKLSERFFPVLFSW